MTLSNAIAKNLFNLLLFFFRRQNDFFIDVGLDEQGKASGQLYWDDGVTIGELYYYSSKSLRSSSFLYNIPHLNCFNYLYLCLMKKLIIKNRCDDGE